MPASRPVFYVSDGTGITAETIGHSLLTQFTAEEFATDRLPFVGKTGYLNVRVTVGAQTFEADLEGPMRDTF